MRKHGLATATATTPTLLTLLMSFVAVARATDYTSDFESSLSADGWSTGANGNTWNRISGSGGTPSGIGATVAGSGSYYAYVEASSPNFPGVDFDLYQTFSESVTQIDFLYFMYGSDMGTLKVQVSSDASTYTTVWSKSGSQGSGLTSWGTASTITVSSFGLSGQTSVRFMHTTGGGYSGDAGVDYIQVSTGTSAPTVLPTPASPAPTITPLPSAAPSMYPTPLPTELPTLSDVPSAPPTISTGPSHAPSVLPSESPSNSPTPLPTNEPSPLPTPLPSVVMNYAAKAPGNEATQRDFNVGKVVPQRIPDQMKQAAFDILTEL